MNSFNFLFFSLLFLYSFSNSDTDFDFYHLRLTWPTSHCLPPNNCTIPSWYTMFSILTFIPRTEDNTPTNCSSTYPFNYAEVSTFHSLLAIMWPDIWNFTNPEDYWKTNWESHGTCSLSELKTEKDYFRQAILLHNRLNPADFLANSQILPSNSIPYSYNQLDNAIRSVTQKNATFHCGFYGDQVVLHEIGFCIDKQFNVFDCSQAMRDWESDRCGSDHDSQSIFYLKSVP
ncbi:ribonuclease 3 [Anaeramoeba ignava]|uniref:Ribonuclease 3 n=1 Tax=Anaeramoeba ignava TaxID=1746090 RepID=A0A9Q0R6I2_ANAIG|nr:ribonuclease 3 [Anaeramoeba ignava]|eukprot:Anaeramoba_ignava/a2937_79.p1 GENE.a2937_79~~a2937_79.p1  ORF type:complete len:231 (+),score=46.91 a2937_79:16-708(+)